MEEGWGKKAFPDRGHFTGPGFNWKKRRAIPWQSKRVPTKELYVFRSVPGNETWSQTDMKEFIKSDMFKAGHQE